MHSRHCQSTEMLETLNYMSVTIKVSRMKMVGLGQPNDSFNLKYLVFPRIWIDVL